MESPQCASIMSTEHEDTLRGGGMALAAPSPTAVSVGPLSAARKIELLD